MLEEKGAVCYDALFYCHPRHEHVHYDHRTSRSGGLAGLLHLLFDWSRFRVETFSCFLMFSRVTENVVKQKHEMIALNGTYLH